MAYGKMRDEDTNQTGLYVSSPVYTSGIGVPDYSTLSGQYDDVMGQILEDYPNYGQVYVPEEPTNLTQSNQSDGSTLSRTAQLMLLSQSGNNGSYAQPVGKVTVSGIKYSGAAPTLGQLPTYKAPEEWSGTKMASETAKKAALGLRQIRQALREATAGLGNDPASRLALRKALAQHGINVQGVMSSAQSAAETSEANELARKAAEAQANFQAELTYYTRNTSQNGISILLPENHTVLPAMFTNLVMVVFIVVSAWIKMIFFHL